MAGVMDQYWPTRMSNTSILSVNLLSSLTWHTATSPRPDSTSPPSSLASHGSIFPFPSSCPRLLLSSWSSQHLVFLPTYLYSLQCRLDQFVQKVVSFFLWKNIRFDLSYPYKNLKRQPAHRTTKGWVKPWCTQISLPWSRLTLNETMGKAVKVKYGALVNPEQPMNMQNQPNLSVHTKAPKHFLVFII